MLVQIAPEIESRLSSWSIATNKTPEDFVNEILEEALEDWEDYTDAVKICKLVDSGKMKTYSFEEVEKELNEMDD